VIELRSGSKLLAVVATTLPMLTHAATGIITACSHRQELPDLHRRHGVSFSRSGLSSATMQQKQSSSCQSRNCGTGWQPVHHWPSAAVVLRQRVEDLNGFNSHIRASASSHS
jgi:hypothetical protein